MYRLCMTLKVMLNIQTQDSGSEEPWDTGATDSKELLDAEDNNSEDQLNTYTGTTCHCHQCCCFRDTINSPPEQPYFIVSSSKITKLIQLSLPLLLSPSSSTASPAFTQTLVTYHQPSNFTTSHTVSFSLLQACLPHTLKQLCNLLYSQLLGLFLFH